MGLASGILDPLKLAVVLGGFAAIIVGCSADQDHKETWTECTDMQLPPAIGTNGPWRVEGVFEDYYTHRGHLVMRTDPAFTGLLIAEDNRINNSIGSTAEIRMKLLSESGGNEINLFSLQDGEVECKIIFFSDHIEVFDQNDLKSTYTMDTMNGFHTYRIAIARNRAEVYVDGEEASSLAVVNPVPFKKLLFGDVSVGHDASINAEVDYIAYSVDKAVTPWGTAVEPLIRPPAPIVEIIPNLPQDDDPLLCTIAANSVHSNGTHISYSYTWYRDGVPQPGLSTDIVNASYTHWGETWKCEVIPHDGVLDGPVGIDETTIGVGMWTRFSAMKVLPESESIEPWQVSGVFERKEASEGILTVQTTHSNPGYFTVYEEGFDNATGSTAEIKMKLLEGVESGNSANLFSLQDGRAECKILFFSNRVEIFDQNDLKSTYNMNTMDGFHIYRLAIAGLRGEVYVDGTRVASIILSNLVPSKEVLFGDLSIDPDANFTAAVDYIAYSIDGAVTPSGEPVRPVNPPTAPSVNVTPNLPEYGNDLVCAITAESVDPEGDPVTYSYAWFKDGVLQPELTTDTVDTSYTEWGETWRCVVTPTDGILNGPSAENEVSIDTGIWTKFSGMQVPPDAEPTSPWQASGVFETKDTSGGALIIKTASTNPGCFVHAEEQLDNDIGSTVEMKLKVIEGPKSDHDAALLSLQNGTREAKICFFEDRFEIFDGNAPLAKHKMDTTDGFHVYTLSILKDKLVVHVDGKPAHMTLLTSTAPARQIIFGDGSITEEENFAATLEYIAYSAIGAVAPHEKTRKMMGEPEAPVIHIEPASPQKEDALVCTITAESIDPDGDPITYSYAWFKDGILQPELITATVAASYTEWGETWRCVVIPNDGILDGPAAEDEVSINTGIWTKFSGMQVPPDAEPTSPWQISGVFETKDTSSGALTIKTVDANPGYFIHTE
ncbi:MAG: hypothetical protein FJZ95_01410, partial [Chloroflexi bacterium]|nr:hypothetical protein [Chloroflexota bacterium]